MPYTIEHRYGRYHVIPVPPSKRTHVDNTKRFAEGRVIAFEIFDKVWGYDTLLEIGKTGSELGKTHGKN